MEIHGYKQSQQNLVWRETVRKIIADSDDTASRWRENEWGNAWGILHSPSHFVLIL